MKTMKHLIAACAAMILGFSAQAAVTFTPSDGILPNATAGQGYYSPANPVTVTMSGFTQYDGYELTGAPSWLTVEGISAPRDPSADRSITFGGTPLASDVGTHTFTLTVKDVLNRITNEYSIELTVTVVDSGAKIPSVKAPTEVALELAAGDSATLTVEMDNWNSDIEYTWSRYDYDAGDWRWISGSPVTASYEYTHDSTLTSSSPEVQIRVHAYQKSNPSVIYGSKTWTIATKGGDSGDKPTIEAPTEVALQLSNAEKVTLSVTVNNATSDIGYRWYRYYSSVGWYQLTAYTTASYAYTHYSSASTPVQFKVEVYDTKTAEVYGTKTWTITTKSSMTFTPATLPEATVGTDYSQVVTISGISSMLGGGCSDTSKLPPGLSCMVKSWQVTITGKPTAAGTYTFPILVQVNPTTAQTGYITVTVKEEVVVPTLERDDPADMYCSMEMGDTKTFSVTGTNLDKAVLQWTLNGEALSCTETSFALTPSAVGGYSLVCYALVDGMCVAGVDWSVDVTVRTNDGRDTYVLDLAYPSNVLQRVSMTAGAFTKTPIFVNNAADIVSVTVAGACPDGLTVNSDGTLTGTMTDDLNGEVVSLLVTDANETVYAVTIVLGVRDGENTRPYAVATEPSGDAATAYLSQFGWPEEQTQFSVAALDEEGDTLSYKWYVDGVATGETSDTFGFCDGDSAHEGTVRTISCCAVEAGRDGVETPIKTWSVTIEDPAFQFLTTTIPDANVGEYAGASIRFRLPWGTTLTGLDLVAGSMPRGTFPSAANESEGCVMGKYRGGMWHSVTNDFTLEATCSNGDTARQSFRVVVTGDRSTPQVWHIDSDGTLGGTTPAEGGEVLESLTEAVAYGGISGSEGIHFPGDTVYLYPTMKWDSKGTALLKYVGDVEVIVRNGICCIQVGDYLPDVSGYKFENGGSLAFLMDPALAARYASATYGTFVRLAYVGTDKSASDYTLYNANAPYFHGVPTIDGEGWLGCYVGVTDLPSPGGQLLNLPDAAGLRDATFGDVEFYPLTVRAAGVLPASLSLAGNVTLMGATVYDGVKTIVKGGATVTLNPYCEINVASGGIEFEAGSTLRICPTDGMLKIVNRTMTLPKAEDGKVTIELTEALPANSYVEYTIASRYVGDDDPMNQFEITKADGDANTYRLVRGDESSLVLTTMPATGDGDPGTLDWSADGATLASAQAGTDFSYTFKAHGEMIEGHGEKVDVYTSYEYSMKDGLYERTFDTENHFDAALGEKISPFLAYHPEYHGATVELGFPFPTAYGYVSSFDVTPCAVGPVMFLDKGRLMSFDNSLDHVYVARTADSCTVRFGLFGMVTFSADGKIRLAFGPEADATHPADPQVPSCTVNGQEYSASSGIYATEHDWIFTPTGYPMGLSFDGATLRGKPLVPGDYSFRVKVVADSCYTLTKTFNLSVSAAAASNVPTIAFGDKMPKAGADGLIHIDAGESKDFSVEVSDGAVLRWTLDGDDLSCSDTSYTLTAPTTRPLDAAGAVVHTLAAEVDDAAGTYNGAIRKVWNVVYNRKVYIDPATTASAEPEPQITVGVDGSTSVTWSEAQDGTSARPYATFPQDFCKYLLTGDEVIVAPATYETAWTPFDFGFNPAIVTIRPANTASETVIRPQGVRGFCQRPTAVLYGASGELETIPMPCANAKVSGIAFEGGAVESDDVTALGNYADSAVRYYGIAGGGAIGGDFTDCVFRNCGALDFGGGAYGARMTRCLVVGCEADFGGGCAKCELENCTIVGNIAATTAGGIDGDCTATKCIIVGNAPNEFAATLTPSRLVPHDSTRTDCFTSGDPRFCEGYALGSGSAAVGKGWKPEVSATAPCRVFVEVVGAGAVSPNEPDGTLVENGKSLTLTASSALSRAVTKIEVDGVEQTVANPFTLANVTANTTVRFTFAAGVITVGADKDYATIADAVAHAGPGDTIKVYPGTYGPIDVSAFAGRLTIEAATDEKPVIDASGASRCVIAKRNSDNVLLRGIVLCNGCATHVGGDYIHPNWFVNNPNAHSSQDLLDLGYGGGAFGGAYENCVISNCVALGGMGGGAFEAQLTGCTVVGCEAGTKADGTLAGAWGGGAFGGALTDCRVTDNWLKLGKYAVCEGAGTYDAEVRNSFVWGNYVDCGTADSAVANNADKGDRGFTVHTSDRVPTEKRLEERKTPIAMEGVSYASQAEAQTAAARQIADVPTEIARKLGDLDAYVDLFEIKTVADGKGGYINQPELKEAVVAEVQAQIDDALTVDDSGNVRKEFNVETMEKTLTETTPGLYYALEFGTAVNDDATYNGERHLATGSGSVKLSATSVDSPAGFWRVKVYTSPTGD